MDLPNRPTSVFPFSMFQDGLQQFDINVASETYKSFRGMALKKSCNYMIAGGVTSGAGIAGILVGFLALNAASGGLAGVIVASIGAAMFLAGLVTYIVGAVERAEMNTSFLSI